MTYILRPEKWNPIYIVDMEYQVPDGQWFILKKDINHIIEYSAGNKFEITRSTAADMVKKCILKLDKPPF